MSSAASACIHTTCYSFLSLTNLPTPRMLTAQGVVDIGVQSRGNCRCTIPLPPIGLGFLHHSSQMPESGRGRSPQMTIGIYWGGGIIFLGVGFGCRHMALQSPMAQSLSTQSFGLEVTRGRAHKAQAQTPDSNTGSLGTNLHARMRQSLRRDRARRFNPSSTGAVSKLKPGLLGCQSYTSYS